MNPSRLTRVDEFLSRHLKPAPGRSAQDVRDRILHWIEIANNPSIVSTNNIAETRRKARQNIRRLVERHPEVANQIDGVGYAR